MPVFEEFIARHGESGVQAIVERLERYEGIRTRSGIPLKDRWNECMQTRAIQPRMNGKRA